MSRIVSQTFRAANLDDGCVRPQLFEPALLHCQGAYRPGDPTFPDRATAARWAGLRRGVTDHVLRRIAESPWGDRLILRGSRMLKAWLGDQAREPGDLDWVADKSLDVSSVDPLFDGLVEAVFDGPGPDGIELVRGGVATDQIWEYERNPGRRAVFPWRAAGFPGGAVQVDISFGETLSDPDLRASVPITDGGCVSVRAASPAQSLAWKLLWLWSDMHAQGKDLYDAVLLAERFPLTRSVLEATFQGSPEVDEMPQTLDSYLQIWNVDWDNFRAEYAWVVGDEREWLDRLRLAIGPAFGEPGPARPVEATSPIDPAWLTSTVVELARGIAADRAWDRLPILSDALQEAGCDRADFLTHCQDRGPHTRSCRVVDLILGLRERATD